MNNFKRNNLVTVVFLALLIMSIVFLANAFKGNGNKEISKQVGSELSQASSIQANDITNAKSQVVPATGFNYVPAQGTPVVLGCSTPSCEFLKTIKYQPVCTEGSASIVVGNGQNIGQSGSGIKVQKNSRIEIVEITAPVALLSGSQYVENNLMAIWSKDKGMNGTFKPSYAMIDPAEAGMMMAPGDPADTVTKVYQNRKVNNFAVNVNIKTDGEDAPTNEPNLAVVNKTLNSVCPSVQKSDPNPDFPNKIAPDLVAQEQAPGYVNRSRAYGNLRCYNDNPNGTTLPNTDQFKTCVADFKPFAFLDFATIAIDKWIECTVPHQGKDDQGNPITIPADPSLCKDTVLYGLRIDAIFGTPYNENAHENANYYLDSKVQMTAAPGDASAMAPKTIRDSMQPNMAAVEPFYVTTNCKVKVDGRSIYTIPCLWDMSAYQRDYQRQKQSAAPGEPNIPATFEEYWKDVEAQIAQRQLQCN
ncbi:MAG TPA: hypothetical protein VHA74_03555 [Candidatus Dojkabacteria bacterium]|nr:hypothetical protein [Candidatus Dojkabacteria bacterium]